MRRTGQDFCRGNARRPHRATALTAAIGLALAVSLAPVSASFAQEAQQAPSADSAPTSDFMGSPAQSQSSGGSSEVQQSAPQPTEAPAASSTQAQEEVTAPAAAAPNQASPAEETSFSGEEDSGDVPDSLLPHDLSPWGMFMNADYVVKTVMIGLAIASFLTWTVLLAKSIEISRAKARARYALKVIASSASLSDAVAHMAGRKGAPAMLVQAADEEMKASAFLVEQSKGEGVKERLASRLSRLEAAAGRRLTSGTGILATIGSVGPFVGLFGTVWGIMNSFIGISEAQTTNLAVVAPGIAEALLATALGLVAAIPAVVIYNAFARTITGYKQLLADASAGVERLVSRELDLRAVAPPSRKPRAAAAE